MKTLPPNRELVVFALGLLGGSTERLHTEDVAIKCHQLFPDSFSWTKYPHLPDKDIVRVALTDARKEKYGALVEGRAGQRGGQPAKTKRAKVQDGWKLTPEGIGWFRANQEALKAVSGDYQTKDHRIKVLRQLRRVIEHPLWERFEQGPDRFYASLGELADLLRCRADAPVRVWEERLGDLSRKAATVEREDLQMFVVKCEEEYRNQS
jgi:hypothetical protein